MIALVTDKFLTMQARLLIILALTVFAVHIAKTSDYEVILESIETAFGDDDKVLKFETLRVKKFNRTTYVVDGKYVIKIPVDDSYTGMVTGYNFQGGQYKKIADKSSDELCIKLYNDTFREHFENFQAAQKYPVPWKTCPYPAGPNEIKNYYVEDAGSMMPAYIPGGEKWKGEIRILKGEEVLGGYNIYAILRNEKSLLGK